MPGAYIPQCTEQGHYEQMQCHGSTGYCWCVTFSGEEIEGSRKGPSEGEVNCSDPMFAEYYQGETTSIAYRLSLKEPLIRCHFAVCSD